MTDEKPTYRIRLKLTGITCDSCGYNLSGHHMGDSCPECGRSCDEFFDDEVAYYDGLASQCVAMGLGALILFFIPVIPIINAIQCWKSYLKFQMHYENNPVVLVRKWIVRMHIVLVLAVLAVPLNLIMCGVWIWWGYLFFK